MSEPLELIAPGEILLQVFMRPHGISQNRRSRGIDFGLTSVFAATGVLMLAIGLTARLLPR